MDKRRIANEFGVSTHIVESIKPEVHFGLFARYGFSLVELNLGYFPLLENARKFRELQDLLVRNKIRVYSFHLPYGGTVPSLGNMDISHPDPDVRRNTIDCIRLCLDRLMILGAPCLVIHPCSGQIEDAEREDKLALCLESLQVCRKVTEELQAKTFGKRIPKIALETLIPGAHLLSTASEILTFFDRLNSDSIGLCVDTNHINLGQDPILFTRQIGALIITTHLSDNDGIHEKHWIPGRGTIDWKQWLSAILSTGYTGPLLYESGQSAELSDDEETVAEIRKNANKLSAIIRKLRSAV